MLAVIPSVLGEQDPAPYRFGTTTGKPHTRDNQEMPTMTAMKNFNSMECKRPGSPVGFVAL
jgi:hypothetical protein